MQDKIVNPQFFNMETILVSIILQYNYFLSNVIFVMSLGTALISNMKNIKKYFYEISDNSPYFLFEIYENCFIWY